VTVQRVAAEAWRTAIADALDGGLRFAAAWAGGAGATPDWHALLAGPGGPQVVACRAVDGSVDTIADLCPAADWDEREAHDLYGLAFRGRAPLRALVAHPADLDAWTTPVSGGGVHQVAVGPIHAGVIESGHFRFHVIGERILALDARLFYKHRGLERAAEGQDAAVGVAYAQRACAACAVTNAVACAQAVEHATGLWPDRALRVARTVALELERLYNHLHDIGAICAGVGFAPGSMAFAALKERAQRSNARVGGHRFLFGAVVAGGGAFALSPAGADAVRGELRELRADAAAAWRELGFAGSLQARLEGVGILMREDAVAFGASGPAARASGVREDVREDSPRLHYDGFVPAQLPAATGDVQARLRLRAAELETTFELLDALLGGPVEAGATAPTQEAAEVGIGRVESPRGATTCAVTLRHGRVARLHLRTGSYANWPALVHASAGSLLADFPLINKSFELCYACVDR
jgi:Ni,Fe-hydrogenase III large subunit